MNKLIEAIMFRLLLIISIVGVTIALWSGSAKAFDVIKLHDLYVDYKNFAMINPNARDLLIYPDKPKESINLGIETNLFDGWGYSNLLVESLVDQTQYRGVGAQYSIGVRLSPYLEIGLYHHSQHVLDRGNETLPRFSTEDAVQVKLHIYKERE